MNKLSLVLFLMFVLGACSPVVLPAYQIEGALEAIESKKETDEAITTSGPTETTPTSTCKWTELTVGDGIFGQGYFLYDNPGSTIVRSRKCFDTVCNALILEGPVCIDGSNWYRVIDTNNNAYGWMSNQ